MTCRPGVRTVTRTEERAANSAPNKTLSPTGTTSFSTITGIHVVLVPQMLECSFGPLTRLESSLGPRGGEGTGGRTLNTGQSRADFLMLT